MSIVLKHRLEASERSADELETEIQRDHREVMLCFDIEDLARSIVGLLADIKRDVDRWQSAMRTQTVDRRRGQELSRFDGVWDGLFRRLATVCEKVGPLIRAVESMGYRVEGKVEFHAAWKELRGLTCFTLDEVARAAEQVARGQTKSLGEVTLELWDRPVH